MAQAQVRLEFAVGTYDEQMTPMAQLYNEYFGGGMAGLVFQELREARALAYSAWAHFFTPSRPEEENILVGAIGCQADKTLEAVRAFLSLLRICPSIRPGGNPPIPSILISYRTNPIKSRSIAGFVSDYHNLGLKEDPRGNRYQTIQDTNIEDLRSFYQEQIQSKSILVSIVGDSEKSTLLNWKKLVRSPKLNQKIFFAANPWGSACEPLFELVGKPSPVDSSASTISVCGTLDTGF